MSRESVDHRRTHNLLLISRLLSLRDNVSPFTLVLDSLSQSAKPLVREYVNRASAAKCQVVHILFETFRPLKGDAITITARRKPLQELQKEISLAVPAGTRTLLIIDSLNPLCSSAPSSLAPFLSSLLTPSTTLLGVYHVDVPLSLPPEASISAYPDSAPHPLVLLKYFCTTLITLYSITHMLAGKQHKDRSLAPPVWGLEEGVDGIVVGLGSNPKDGVVLKMEYRRKSGRGVVEWFYMPLRGVVDGVKPPSLPGAAKEKIILLEDHPQWRLSEQVKRQDEQQLEEDVENGEPRSTFELGLTQRQKKARDEVVLPYFDAQRDGGIGGGGAILFTPDKEIDDFDEEEDEI